MLQTSLLLGFCVTRLHFATKSGKCLKRKRKWPIPECVWESRGTVGLIRTNWIVALSFRIEFSLDRVLDGKHPELALEYAFPSGRFVEGEDLQQEAEPCSPNLQH